MAEGVRQRVTAQANPNVVDSAAPDSTATDDAAPKTEKKPKADWEGDEDEDGPITLTDILRILTGVLILSCLLSYFITNESYTWGWRPWFSRPEVVMRWLKGPVLLTDAELTHYDGSDPSLPLYLALNGTIYDVTKGHRIYGPGGSYHVFAGKDAARGFVTGCFAEDATPDLRGAEWTYVPTDVPALDERNVGGPAKVRREQELRKARAMVHETIDGWRKMFAGEGGKGYFEVGRVVREEGWLEKLPQRKLCAQAERGRPSSKDKAEDKGSAYRDS